MGLNYSFVLITEPKKIDLALRELACFACERDAARINAAIPWKPEIQHDVVWGSGEAIRQYQGIGGPKEESERGGNDYCFLFQPDPALEAYEKGLGLYFLDRFREHDKIVVGCLWTSLHVGQQYALFEFTAATSHISRLFLASKNVKDAFVALAARSESTALFLDSEDAYEWFLLYPQARLTAMPNKDCFCSDDFKILRVDAYCMEVLHLSRL
jgi:hypothetical protein